MKFRTKALISLILIITFIFLVVVIGSYLLLSANIQTLERDYVSTQVERGQILLNAMQDRYLSTVQDWGWWNETYDFMTTSDPIKREQYVTHNLNEEGLGVIGVDIVFLLRPDGSIVQMFFSNETKPDSEVITSTLIRERNIPKDSENQNLSYSHSWISVMNHEPVLFAETNILQNVDTGPPAGTLIMGHLFTKDDIQYLESIVDAKVRISDVNLENEVSPDTGQNKIQYRNSTIFPLSDDTIMGIHYVFGYTPEIKVPFSLTLQRDIFAIGQETWKWNLLFLGISGFFILIFSLFVFDQFFLSRMTLLSERVTQLQQQPETDPESLIMGGNDEIQDLSIAMYGLVARLIQKTREVSGSEKRFWEMTSLLPTPVFETDTKGLITFSNKAFQEMFGLTEDTATGTMLASMILEDGSEHADLMNLPGKEIPLKSSGECVMKGLDGTKIPVIFTCVPNYDEELGWIGNRGVIVDISEMKKNEEMIKESEQKYRILTELLPVAVFESDPDGLITFVNTAALKLFHIRYEEMMGITLETLTGYSDPGTSSHESSYILPNGVHEGEFQIKRHDGTLFTAMIRSDDLIPHNPALGRRGVIIDISAMKEAQNAVTESEKRFRELTELLPVTVFETDLNATLTFVNSAAFRTFQYTQDDLNLGINLFQLFIPESIPQALEIFSSSVYQNEENQMEYLMIKKDGTIFPAVIISSSIISGGSVTGRRGVILDLSDIKITQSALIESEERLNLAVEAASLGIWSYDILTEKTTVNDQFAHILGYDLDTFYAKRMTFISVIHPDDRKDALSSVARCITGESERFMSEFRMITMQGTIIWTLNIGKITNWGVDKIPKKMSGITMDMTTIRQIRAALIETNRKLNLLSSVTRHDITNSLSGIYLTLEVFSETMAEIPEAQEFIELIQEGMEKIHNQISFTKDYEELGATEPAWYSVSDQLQAVVATLPDKKIRFVNKTGSLAIFADPLIEKVFYNLMENAFRHGGERLTMISVDYSFDGDDLLIHIYNDGIGIPPEEKEEIFRRGIGKNTGLGLFLTREILAITSMEIHECGLYPDTVIFDIRVPKGNFRL